MFSTWESSEMTATELPSAIPAVRSGSVAASSEPNTRNRTTSAAAAPEADRADAGSVRGLRDLAFDLDLDAVSCARLGGVHELALPRRS